MYPNDGGIKLFINSSKEMIKPRGRTPVCDMQGYVRWFVQGENEDFTVGRKLGVYDSQERQAALIWFKPVILGSSGCSIEIGGYTFELLSKSTLFRKTWFLLTNTDWVATKKRYTHYYTVMSGTSQVMLLSQYVSGWDLRYELDISRLENELLGLCFAVAIIDWS